MTSRYWPIDELRVRTPRLELRPPDAADLDALAELAAQGIHDPRVMPFCHPWTDAEPGERARSVVLHHHRVIGGWERERWTLPLAVVESGTVLGVQDIGARNFPTLHEVNTGSWLGRRYHGRGIGTEMRAAVLHLAFQGLGAEFANSSAFRDNPASRAVSGKLGYVENGVARSGRRGLPAEQVRLRLSRSAWRRRDDIEISRLAACLPLMGAGAPVTPG